MRLAATHAETWVTVGDRSADRPARAAPGAQLVREQIERLADACGKAGREPRSIGRLVLSGPSLDPGLESIETFQETLGRYADARSHRLRRSLAAAGRALRRRRREVRGDRLGKPSGADLKGEENARLLRTGPLDVTEDA
jgi:hypothetical protein